MRLKGEMVIELIDTNTGAVETVQETNMITEAVNNILGLNPMGIYLKASWEYDNSVLWNGTLLPICPNMIGGILLFPAVLEEKADHIYEQGKNLPVAYASNNVNSGSNVARGSLNQTESKKLDNGYKFVWEFTPSQGNGNIAAVALTSALGGQNAFGSEAGDFQITADDRVIKTQGSARFEAMATPLFQYKNFVFMWGGSYGKEHRCAYLLTPYLASINNLSSAVVKNTDKTMKITYMLTEETM